MGRSDHGTLSLAALALFVIGTFGLFGQKRDPSTGFFLMPLGLPLVLDSLKLPFPSLR
jgi:hypothetical protein